MSDQDTKPAEGVETPVVETPVETTQADVIESTTAPTAPEADDHQEVAEVKVEDTENTENNVKDTDEGNDLDTLEVKDETTGATEVQKDKVESEQTAKSTEAQEGKGKEESQTKSNGRKWPSTRFPPKNMLKVNRNGCPTREKSDPSVLPDSDDPKAIRWQVEFYFSDSNLPSDKFLWSKTDGSKNKPVPLSLICSFSRMRRFKSHSAVVDALKTSDILVLEGPEGEETIRRKEPCQPSDELSRKIDERTTYIKGFGEESKSTQFDIETFLSQFGEINAVRLRRNEEDKERPFKGSIFVEWVDQETASKFYELDPEPRWNDHTLMIMPKIEYERQSEEEERRTGKFQKDRRNNGQRQQGNRGGRGRGSHESRGNHRGGFDSNNWKKRREDDQKNGSGERRGRREHRGRGRGNPRGRGQDRPQNGDGHTKEEQPTRRDDEMPRINISKQTKMRQEEEAKHAKEAKANGKRARDDDTTTDVPPAKKVDTKEPVAA
ncbi:hypothetical protein F4804DRAFT_297401 [Jackrogersella minutella]|nr:hypothetical protein F4804DRAFT_297401 [Jackrogersella minutella]